MTNYRDIEQRLINMGEIYAAGFFELPDSSMFVRYARGLRRYLEGRCMPIYSGEKLYPCNSFDAGLCFAHDYSYTVKIDWQRLSDADEVVAEVIRQELSDYEINLPKGHAVGGKMYTHSFPNFKRILREGLDSYQKRVEAIKDPDIRNGLLDVLEGIRCFHGRALELLKGYPQATRLYAALKKVPFKPADTLYEALVGWNFIYYMDGCDDIGRLDADLIDYYKGEDVTDILRQFFKNVDANDGWSGALGPEYNPLTIQCLKAVKGIRRPSLELRVTPEMSGQIWDAAIETVCSGGGNPSFYNEYGYQKALNRFFPDIPKEDRMRFCGGGCTETMLAGISNVGSCDAGINLAMIFEKVMREELPECKDFDGFYAAYIQECHKVVEAVTDAVSENQKKRSKYRPQPMRTLLVDDCIDREKDFNNGGARYSWSIINLAGLINVLDSLLVIQQLVYMDKVIDADTLLKQLNSGETFMKHPNIPRHGYDHEQANDMAKRLSTDICSAFEGITPYLGGKFLPASIQFTTYVWAGRSVGATPDGRGAGAPLCDSIGAIHGNDKYGVTAMLNSAASLSLEEMPGTPVLNIKLDTNQAVKSLKHLVSGYFNKNGMQLQVTCVGKEELMDARDHPEKYPNLIVRIGGYSEYFARLTKELRQTVIDRTFYGE